MATFPDIPLEQLCSHASMFTLENSRWLLPEYGNVLGPMSFQEKDIFMVPNEVKDLIPQNVQTLLGCNGSELIVVRDLDGTELCAGCARVTKCAHLLNKQMIAADLKYRSNSNIMDFSTEEGSALATILTCRTRSKGLQIRSPQCSTWVWMSRSAMQRSAMNIDGNTQRADVCHANKTNNFFHTWQICVGCWVFTVWKSSQVHLYGGRPKLKLKLTIFAG